MERVLNILANTYSVCPPPLSPDILKHVLVSCMTYSHLLISCDSEDGANVLGNACGASVLNGASKIQRTEDINSQDIDNKVINNDCTTSCQFIGQAASSYLDGEADTCINHSSAAQIITYDQTRIIEASNDLSQENKLSVSKKPSITTNKTISNSSEKTIVNTGTTNQSIEGGSLVGSRPSITTGKRLQLSDLVAQAIHAVLKRTVSTVNIAAGSTLDNSNANGDFFDFVDRSSHSNNINSISNNNNSNNAISGIRNHLGRDNSPLRSQYTTANKEIYASTNDSYPCCFTDAENNLNIYMAQPNEISIIDPSFLTTRARMTDWLGGGKNNPYRPVSPSLHAMVRQNRSICGASMSSNAARDAFSVELTTHRATKALESALFTGQNLQHYRNGSIQNATQNSSPMAEQALVLLPGLKVLILSKISALDRNEQAQLAADLERINEFNQSNLANLSECVARTGTACSNVIVLGIVPEMLNLALSRSLVQKFSIGVRFLTATETLPTPIVSAELSSLDSLVWPVPFVRVHTSLLPCYNISSKDSKAKMQLEVFSPDRNTPILDATLLGYLTYLAQAKTTITTEKHFYIKRLVYNFASMMLTQCETVSLPTPLVIAHDREIYSLVRAYSILRCISVAEEDIQKFGWKKAISMKMKSNSVKIVDGDNRVMLRFNNETVNIVDIYNAFKSYFIHRIISDSVVPLFEDCKSDHTEISLRSAVIQCMWNDIENLIKKLILSTDI